jgi:hypothetical protein
VYRSLARESETPCVLVFNLAGLPFDPFDVRERKQLAMQKGTTVFQALAIGRDSSSGQTVPLKFRPSLLSLIRLSPWTVTDKTLSFHHSSRLCVE